MHKVSLPLSPPGSFLPFSLPLLLYACGSLASPERLENPRTRRFVTIFPLIAICRLYMRTRARDNEKSLGPGKWMRARVHPPAEWFRDEARALIPALSLSLSRDGSAFPLSPPSHTLPVMRCCCRRRRRRPHAYIH